ncbi:MAG: hypothetical protein GY862_25660 [Gammaproteobacteria bacterium]|nr:hypothetical protein [Gammaproteobacteria bacterium]
MRLIAMGAAPLTEGFDLLGFETFADAGVAEMESLLCELAARKDKALVFLEQSLARQGSKSLKRIREESAQVIIIEVPPLHAPGDYSPPVEELVRRVLGPSALEESSWQKT